MTKDKSALKMALEALENHCGNYKLDDEGVERFVAACKAIKEALAQPEQEPLEYWNTVEGWVKIDEVREHFDSVGCGTIYKTAGEDRVPVYTTPEPRNFCPRCGKRTPDLTTIHTCVPPRGLEMT